MNNTLYENCITPLNILYSVNYRNYLNVKSCFNINTFSFIYIANDKRFIKVNRLKPYINNKDGNNQHIPF